MLFLVLASAGIVVAAFNFKQLFPSINTQQASNQETSNQKPVSSKNNYLKGPFPFNSDPSAVKWLNLIYGFEGKITQIKDVKEGKELVLDIKAEGLPRFIVNDKTPILKKSNDSDKGTPVSLADLQIGQKVVISAHYSSFDLRRVAVKFTKVDAVTFYAPSSGTGASSSSTTVKN